MLKKTETPYYIECDGCCKKYGESFDDPPHMFTSPVEAIESFDRDMSGLKEMYDMAIKNDISEKEKEIVYNSYIEQLWKREGEQHFYCPTCLKNPKSDG